MHKNDEVYCNNCGKKIKSDKGILQEDVLQVEKIWGYFSNKDGERHSFDLCETCYDKMIEGFKLPVEKEEEEILI